MGVTTMFKKRYKYIFPMCLFYVCKYILNYKWNTTFSLICFKITQESRRWVNADKIRLDESKNFEAEYVEIH
jgi:hypothetical protein